MGSGFDAMPCAQTAYLVLKDASQPIDPYDSFQTLTQLARDLKTYPLGYKKLIIIDNAMYRIKPT